MERRLLRLERILLICLRRVRKSLRDTDHDVVVFGHDDSNLRFVVVRWYLIGRA